jgi:Fe-S-cluster-containing dehydrogenase component
LQQFTRFDKEAFDFSLKDFVIENCSADVISYDAENDTMKVDQSHCIRCRQCEVASNGAFEVMQPWQGTVLLRRELCVEGCFACADVCPTRALHINDEGELVHADYFCIKCGACMQICPIKAEWEEYEVHFDSQGITYTRTHKRLTNADALPVLVERWRAATPTTESAARLEALESSPMQKPRKSKLTASAPFNRRDLIVALKGGKTKRTRRKVTFSPQ